jgi:hypothetical protein
VQARNKGLKIETASRMKRLPKNRLRLGGYAPFIDWHKRYASVNLTGVCPDDPEDEQYMRMAYWELWGERIDNFRENKNSFEEELSRTEMDFLLQFQGGKCGKEMEEKLNTSFLQFIRRCRNGGSPATRACRRSYPPQAPDAAPVPPQTPDAAPVPVKSSTLIYPDDIIWAIGAFILCVSLIYAIM